MKFFIDIPTTESERKKYRSIHGLGFKSDLYITRNEIDEIIDNDLGLISISERILGILRGLRYMRNIDKIIEDGVITEDMKETERKELLASYGLGCESDRHINREELVTTEELNKIVDKSIEDYEKEE